MQGLAKFADLFPTFKARTADMRMLSAETCSQPPFVVLKDLGAAVEHRLIEDEVCFAPPLRKPWLQAMAEGLRRAIFDHDDETNRVREVATRLLRTVWQPCDRLRVLPYIDGTPAGEPFSPDVVWHEYRLYVKDRPLPKVFNAIVTELSRPFSAPQIADAFKACAERDPSFIAEYLAANFDLEDQPLFDEVAAEDTLSADPEFAPGELQSSPVDDSNGPTADIEGHERLEGAVGVSGTGPFAADGDDGNVLTSAPSRPTRVRRPREDDDPVLIARFARKNGYIWNPIQRRYTHVDGTWLQKCDGGFNWERYSADGDVLCRYWVSEQSLANGGIEIAADLWELIKRAPNESGLVLEDDDEQPEEISGAELVQMVHENMLGLFPAKYRIRKTLE